MTSETLVEPLNPPRDARGFVVEPLTLSGIRAQQNVHVVWTAPGAVRGNHYHKAGTETALVIGPAIVRYRDTKGVRDIRIPRHDVYRVTFPPGVAHAYGAVGPEPMLLVVFNTAEYNRDRPDSAPDMLLEPTELRT